MRFNQLGRREFIALIGGAAAWPLAVRAQQAAMPVIGFLNSVSSDTFAHLVDAFRNGLSEVGIVEGRNAVIEYRWADGKYDRLPKLATELVERQVTVITAAGGEPSAIAAKRATTAIPIVFVVNDAVQAGLVKSIGRPESNLTGINIFTVTLAAKHVELLRELVPKAKRLAALVNPTFAVAVTYLEEVKQAARALGLELRVLNAGSEEEIDASFASIVKEPVDALIVVADPFFLGRRNQLISLTAHHALPTIYALREFPVGGGLISYGTNIADVYRQAGIYTGKILKGAKPADLPVLQPTKFDLVINLRTAKTLGLRVPVALQVAANEVIE
jgi:putative ABC transport system substrate-binding protein